VLKKNKEWRDQNRERFNASRRDSWKRSGDEVAIRRKMQMRAYRLGIPVERLADMERQQDNKCFLCGQAGGRTKGTVLQLDHCHRTGRVRALLCGRCNGLLARAEDSPELLQRVIAYLKGEIG
jgi:hypothetical protein